VSEEKNEYQILITLPPHYDASKSYATLYYLDAWWLEDIVKGTYNLLHRSKTVEEIILVGISIDGNELEFNQQRTRDYTPQPYDKDVMKFPMSIPLESGNFQITDENSGKSAAFITFIKDKVFPEISKNYSIKKEHKAFIGHSFGGLFGIYMAFDDVALFDNYIIISPALWWNKSQELYDKLATASQEDKREVNLFICYGELEGKSITNTTNRLVE
jgi:predicted alpha/beta superfamily hydrolase